MAEFMDVALSPAGYSGTPLAKKLSLKDGMAVWFDGMPEAVRGDINAFGLTLDHCTAPRAPLDAAHIFVTSRQDMVSKLAQLEPLLAPAGFIWVSWPKKQAKIETDITEDVIRAMVLPGGRLVDVKVCAVDAIWSGLKLMIRKSAR
jgi:hypothetical protein